MHIFTLAGINCSIQVCTHCKGPYEYVPIAKALHKLDDGATGRLKRKFDVAYLIAKQNLAFSKMTPLCELEERHGVDLGEGYKKSKSCAVSTDYITKDLQRNLVASLSKVRYFSLQAMVELIVEISRMKSFSQYTLTLTVQTEGFMCATNFLL